MKKLSSILLSLICVIACAIGFASCGGNNSKEIFRLEKRGENGQFCTIFVTDTDISGDITIPATYDGEHVTNIGEHSFKNCNNIESIIISEGIEHINHYAFKDCSARRITIPTSVKSLGYQSIPWSNTGIYQIDYLGTIEQWTKIEGITYVAYFTHVICTDGEWDHIVSKPLG